MGILSAVILSLCPWVTRYVGMQCPLLFTHFRAHLPIGRFYSFMYQYKELIRSSNCCECIASGHLYLHIVIEVPDTRGLTPVAIFCTSLQSAIYVCASFLY